MYDCKGDPYSLSQSPAGAVSRHCVTRLPTDVGSAPEGGSTHRDACLTRARVSLPPKQLEPALVVRKRLRTKTSSVSAYGESDVSHSAKHRMPDVFPCSPCTDVYVGTRSSTSTTPASAQSQGPRLQSTVTQSTATAKPLSCATGIWDDFQQKSFVHPRAKYWYYYHRLRSWLQKSNLPQPGSWSPLVHKGVLTKVTGICSA